MLATSANMVQKTGAQTFQASFAQRTLGVIGRLKKES